jgi:hypothetical protein
MVQTWVPAPDGAQAPHRSTGSSTRWSTLPHTLAVLFVVHTLASANRLADLVPLFESDFRVQLVFTRPDSASFPSGVDDHLHRSGAATISWKQAVHTTWDLVITANTSGNLEELSGPIVLVSHGVGYSKTINPKTRKPENPKTRKPVYGLSAQSLLSGGHAVHEAIVLSHHEQLDRLAATVPEALDRAVVAGDPRFDRMLASRSLRANYRAALGVSDDQRLVLVSSTWWSRSLFGSWPELLRRLMAELPVDRYRLVAVLHPHVWQWHSSLQVRLWLADCLRAGMVLVPPAEGWSAAVIAADQVIGDHGAVSCYAAAFDKPTLLAAFPRDDVADGSCVDALGRLAPELDRRRPLLAQLERSAREFVPGSYQEITELVSAAPGAAATRLRALCYRLLGLTEPPGEAPVPMLPAPRLPRSAARPWAAALRVSGARTGPRDVTMVRYPADGGRKGSVGSESKNLHLVVHAEHPFPGLRDGADIVFADSTDPVTDPRGWLEATLSGHPFCFMAAVPVSQHDCLVMLRDGRSALLRTVPGTARAQPLVAASALYLWLADSPVPAPDTPLPATLHVDLGSSARPAFDLVEQ